MPWKIKNNIIRDENGLVVGELAKESNSYHHALIRYSPEMFDAILQLCLSLEVGKSPRNPKKHYDRFQEILKSISDEAS